VVWKVGMVEGLAMDLNLYRPCLISLTKVHRQSGAVGK